MPLDREVLPFASFEESSAAGLLHAAMNRENIGASRGPTPRARTVPQATGDRLVITRTIQRKAKSGFDLYGGVFLGTGQVVDPEHASYVPVQCQNNQNLSNKQSHDLKISVSLSIAYLVLKASVQALIL
jgi:hypothetical protein